MFGYRYIGSASDAEWCLGPATEYGGPWVYRNSNTVFLNMFKNSQVTTYKYTGTAEQWYHITLIYSEENGFEHYIDGNYMAASFDRVWSAQSHSGISSFLIGKNYKNTGASARCELDEIYLWYEVKGQDFIQGMYNLWK